MVEFVFILLKECYAKLETKIDIDYALDKIIFEYIRDKTPDSSRFDITDVALKTAVVTFLLAAQMGIEIRLKDQFIPTGEKEYTGMKADDWLIRLPL